MKLLATTALALSAATGASAVGFDGADLSYTYHSYDGGDFYNQQIEGRLSFSITPQIGAQLDLGGAGYDSDGVFEDTNYGLHVFYNVNDMTAVGVFWGRSAFGGGSYEDYIGVEASFSSGAFTGQAFFGGVNYDGEDPFNGRTVAGILGEYTLEGMASGPGDLTLFGRYNQFNYGSDDISRMYGAGARYTLTNGLYGELELGRYDDDFSDYDRITVTVGYEIGSGAKFERRDYYEVWQGY